MGFRTASVWSMALCAAVAVGLTGGAQEPAPRGLPLPPIEPIPRLPVVPSFDDTPPPRPSTSTSFQLPRDTRPPAAGREQPPRPGPPREVEGTLPVGSAVTLPVTSQQLIRFGPRYGKLNDAKGERIPDSKSGQRVTYLGGLIVNVRYLEGASVREVEFAADNVVMWIYGVKNALDLGQPLQVDKGKPEDDKAKDKEEDRVRLEMYLSGNVVIRTRTDNTFQGVAEQVLRADEIYYDVDTSRAVAVRADLETKFNTGFDSIHLRGNEIWQLGRHEYKAFDALAYSSKLPSDPALTLHAATATFTEQMAVRRNVFGRPYRNTRTGEPDVGFERILTTEENTVELLGVPVSYFRRLRTDINDPGGPLTGLGFRSDRVFGLVQAYTSWDMYKLLGLRGPAGNQWLLHLDYLSLRGPGVGSDFLYENLFGTAYKNVGDVSVYGLYDNKREDLLGGFRGPEPTPPYYRGRFIWTHNQDLFETGDTFTRFTGQFAYLSDKNFYEQFYKLRFDQDPNQETFAYLYGARGNLAWSLLGEVNVNRPWVTETQWLPRADAALIGQSFFDTLSWTTRANAGYARFRPATQEPFPAVASETDSVNTLRADWSQRLSLPFDLGPVRLEPYGVSDLTAYSADRAGDGVGRLYGGGGVKASVPFSRLYADVASDMLNLRGIYHKVELRANYFVGATNTDPTQLPLLDRLNDDVSDLSYRSFRRYGGLYTAPGTNGDLLRNTPRGVAIATSPIFDPVQLANRRLLDGRPEVLDDMQVLQGEIRQRWQTKRGPEGNEHTVDVMALNVGASLFPDRVRDNYGSSIGQVQYDWLWNVGDRVAVTSAGWYDPFQHGTRYFNAGVYFNRPDGSNLYLGYRHTDPIGSRVFIAALGYQFSRKYSITVSNAFDLSSNFAQNTSIAFNRTGTDMTMSLGLSYNAFQNNLGVQFLLIPNAALASGPFGIRNLFQ